MGPSASSAIAQPAWVTAKKQTPCDSCKGEGVVANTREFTCKIPAGIADGSKLKFPGQGNAAGNNGKKGSLFVVVKVESDKVFTREGTAVHVNIPIKLSTAVLGGKVTVPSLNGDMMVKVPSGTQSGDKLKMKGLGITDINFPGSKGDQIVHLTVEIPKTLTTEQTSLMQQFAKTQGTESPGEN